MAPLVRLPDGIDKRFDVMCSDGPIGCKLAQLDSGPVVVRSFQRVAGNVGPVEASGKVHVGDALMCVNYDPIELLTYDDVLAKIRGAERPVCLTFGQTGEAVAKEIRERAVKAALKAQSERQEKADRQRQQDSKRAAELKAASAAQKQAATVGLGRHAAASSSAPSQASRPGVQPAARSTIYTARDFGASKATPFQKQVCALLTIFFVFVLLSMVNFFPSSQITNEDDLQLFEEWRAHKKRIDAEAIQAEQLRKEKNEVFGDFDFEANMAALARSNATSSPGAGANVFDIGGGRKKSKFKRNKSMRGSNEGAGGAGSDDEGNGAVR